MRYFRDERGLAMLETMIATAVIVILASSSLPKVGGMLDAVYVDCEIRALHSLMHYTQSAGRISSYSLFGFEKPFSYNTNTIELFIATDNGSNATPYYCVRKLNTAARIKEDRRLERNFKISLNNVDSSTRFNVHGDPSPVHAGSITVRKDTVARKLVLTDYGRIKIERCGE